MRSALIVACLAGLTSTATANSLPVVVDGSELTRLSSELVEARFRADANNWDTRLADNGNPTPGDVTGEVANGSNFEGQTFGFELRFDSTTEIMSWSITRPNETVSSIQFLADDFGGLNTIQLASTGSRADLTFSGMTFEGFGSSFNGFENIDVASEGRRSASSFLFFGNGFDLLSGDWALGGLMSISDITRRNASEGAKITLRLTNTAGPELAVVPAPTAAAAGLFGLGVLAARRRR